MATNLSFETFAQDAHEYVNELAQELGHPKEPERALILWRAVMHTIRDRIHPGESIQLLAPLPMIFKGIYVEDWKYSEKPEWKFSTIEEMKEQVKKLQERYGEDDFSWSEPTEELISRVIFSLKKFMKQDQLQHLKGQLPKELQQLVA